MTPALRLSDVSVVSSSGLRQLDTVSLDLNMGDLLGIIGPNGAGKTTLLRTALALVPHASGRSEKRSPPSEGDPPTVKAGSRR